ncbi:MAG TPA: c(7)-type cytochrome triheme domain-containing protein [Nitrospiria bacterium]|nr:c(7)-type cytochrome triheme domain-containing protein [Nitrospiria bacterium]
MHRKGRRLFWGMMVLLGTSGALFYACTQSQKEMDTLNAKPAAAAEIPKAVPVQAPAQAREGTTSTPLTAPNPSEPEYEDPTKLPTPGPPYGRDNRNPEVVLKSFPKDAIGADDWVKAFKENEIKPHESLDLAKKPVPPFNFDVEIPAIGAMPNVIFPHFPHTFWLDCANCHPAIFQMKKGANPISMVKIVNGEFCGRCHGRIAFPIANCTRCHVKPKG